MSRCAAVYVELGERPELDGLRRCTLDIGDCWEHEVQLDWVRADLERLAAYNEQLRRYELGQRIGGHAEQQVLA